MDIRKKILCAWKGLIGDQFLLFWVILSAIWCFGCAFRMWYTAFMIYYTEVRPSTTLNMYIDVPGQPPVITEYRTIIMDGDAEFLCVNETVEKNSDFVWHKDDYPIAYEKSRLELNNETGILSIFNARKNDRGYYECFYFGVLESAIHVNVQDPPKIIQFEISKVKLGEKSAISCIVEYGANPIQIKLLKNGKEITQVLKNSIINTSSQVATLNIEKVTENDKATYTCVTHTEGYYDFQTAKLEIEDEPEKMYDVYNLNEGESLTMICNTSTNYSNVVWKKEIVGDLGTKYYLDVVGVTQNQNLVINDVSKEESGTYWCVYDNEIDIYVGAINRLEITTVPRLLNTYTESNMILNEGQNLTIKLMVLGNDISKIEWYRKGKLISMKEHNTANRYVNNFIQDDVMYTELVLENIKMADRGKYMCVVYNEHGQDYTSVLVWVKDGLMDIYLLIMIICISIILLITLGGILWWYLYKKEPNFMRGMKYFHWKQDTPRIISA